MKPRCVIGSGVPPRFVSQITHNAKSGTICITTRGQADEIIHFSSRADLLAQCQHIASQHVPFSIGGYHGSWGPADELVNLQQEWNVVIPYFDIKWKNPEEWTIHEKIPGATEWEIVKLSDIYKEAI